MKLFLWLWLLHSAPASCREEVRYRVFTEVLLTSNLSRGVRWETWQQVDIMKGTPPLPLVCTLYSGLYTPRVGFREREDSNLLMDLLLSIICYQLAQQDAAFQSSSDNNCHPGAPPPVLHHQSVRTLSPPSCISPSPLHSVCTHCSLPVKCSQDHQPELSTRWTFWTPAWDFQFQHPAATRWTLSQPSHRPLARTIKHYFMQLLSPAQLIHLITLIPPRARS